MAAVVWLSLALFTCCFSSAQGQRELIASRDANHDCWRPLTANDNAAEEHNTDVFYVYVSEDEKTCYYLSTKRSTYPKAEETCTSLASGSNLFSDASWEENQLFISTVIPSCDYLQVGRHECSVWLGLQWNGTCSWKDGTKFRFFNWPREVSDQCSQPYSSRYCAYVDRSGSWDVSLCLKELPVLCEWRIVLPPDEAVALASANSAKTAGIFFLILLLLILILLIIFILLGRFYFCPKIRDAVVFAIRGNAPDVESNKPLGENDKNLEELEEMVDEPDGDQSSAHEIDNYETIPIRGTAKDDNDENEIDVPVEGTPLMQDSKATEAPGSPPVVEEPKYATPIKKKNKQEQPNWDEITEIA
ncbi:hypothetical protein CAPTEDRAFT_221816 [Capitella teleta]|uniref:C-type lectin domain-containing protein n=1 Tax=Capitella teleta TaxID=283909 RepID=R7VEL9_CAPTE|nr:hypothetical protein CAPTEDRAFT_221816 [Capitella teleta]|eukprot:ELU17079.1 hypothetical protein CAPTEDRAFT_221816 [Capitella teleta]